MPTGSNNEKELMDLRSTPTTAISDRADRELLEREEPPHRPVRPPLDANLYATKKTVAKGMMDIALLTANASQLKYVLREGENSSFYHLNVVCISLSIFLQVVVGILLILNSRYNINVLTEQQKADRLNNFIMIGIFLITIINIFVSAFGTSQ